VLNLALRNTDNHARNTAVQRLSDGSVQLTPLFDFAPMFMDPEVVPRTIHWRNGEGVRLDTWAQVLESIDLPDREREALLAELGAFAPVVARLPEIARECSVDERVIEQCLRSIEAQAAQLQALPQPGKRPPAVRSRRKPGHG
jgi:serine/threonine-protein kinase HipA